MNLSAIYSKTGKGVQEASGKTSHLSRADRAVLSAIDGKTPLTDVLTKFEKLTAPKFEALIEQLDKEGFIREVSTGASQHSGHVSRTVPPPRGAPPPKAPAPSGDDDEGLDFTQAIKPSKGPVAAPKGPTVDLAAASRAEAERKAKEQEAFDYKAREEAEARAKAEAEAKARAAAAESRARIAAEEKARAEAEAKARAEADAKVKAARDAAIRLATEAKAKGEAAEERARREAEEKARLEAELNAKLAEERKAREEAERRAQEAAERARRELEEKAKRDAEEMRQRLEAEMKAKLEEERKAREAEDRKRREEEDRKRREEEERRRKEEQERRAKEEAERKAREAEDRKRREEEDRKRRKEDEERRAREEAERRARREEEERRAKEDAERRKREEAERKARDEGEAKARAAQSASLPAIEPAAATAPPAAAAPSGAGGIGDSLLADLDSFSAREEEETRAKEEADRAAKEKAARRAKEEAERNAKEEADRKRREEEDRRRKEDEERRAREEAERRESEEEERRKEEEAERKRKAKEALAAKKTEQSGSHPAIARAGARGEDDIEVTDEDLDMDDIKRDQKVLATTARKVEREFEPPPPVAVPVAARRRKKWGKPAAIALFVLLVGGVGLLNVMPVSTGDYEKAASEAIGAPVKIGSARLSVLAGVQIRFENVSIGDGVKIRLVRGSPEIGSLFGGRKAFSRIELEGASISQAQLGAAVFGKVSGDNFRVGRIVMTQAKFEGPLALPVLDVEAIASSDGSLRSVAMHGGDKLSVQLSPNGSEVGFEMSAASFAVPFVPALTLLEFGMKGTANSGGVTASEFDGRLFDGVLNGKAKIRWGANWNVDGDLRARGMKVAVFAPALVSEGRVEANGTFSMSGPVPANLFESARVQGDFKIEKGVLGSFDLTRALKTGGAQSTGSTSFSELAGQAVYDKGTLQLRNIAITAGGMNAGASLDIDANGGLAGRVVADVKTPTQSLRATLNISGKVQDPVIRK